MKLNDFKKELLDDPNFRKEYFKHDLSFEVGQMITDARIIKGITQKELAKKINTQQPSIARIESGSILPSLGFLKKIANAFDTYLIAPKFGFMEEMECNSVLLDPKNAIEETSVKQIKDSFKNDSSELTINVEQKNVSMMKEVF